jgi:hypothetical protein
MSRYVKDPDNYAELSEKVGQLGDKDLAEALMVALNHQTQLNYDTLAAVYDASDEDVRAIMEQVGVIIVLRHTK